MPADYLLLESGDHLLLESGDDLLLESSTVDQSIALPLVDDSAVYGPNLTIAGLIELPLIDDAGTFPPVVFEDKTLDLPLLDDSAVYGPSVSGAIDLPLLDDSQVFGPDVFVDQSAALPLLDDSAIYGPSFLFDESVPLPLLEGGWVFAPTVLGAVVEGLVVKVGATELDGSFARSFRDELGGAGSWSLSLPNGDADMPAFDDVVTYWVDGLARFSGPVTAKRLTTFAPGEEVDEVTVLSGLGRLAVTNRGMVEPSRGIGAFPVEQSRSESWMSFNFDDSAWPASKRIRRADVRTVRPPNRFSPEWWPAKQAWWVWANRSDVSEWDAPGGRCLFRSTPIVVPEDGPIAVLAGMDNFGSIAWDGFRIIDTENDSSSYTIGRRVVFEVSAGEHVLSANVMNTGRGGGLIYSVWTVDAEGLLDEQIAYSDSSSTLCLPYPFPNNPPMVTAGWAVRQWVEEAQARGELPGLVLDFTDTQASNGEPFSPVAEITVDVGRSIFEALESLSDWLVDVQMAPGADVLRLWNWGTRGGTPGVSVAATADPDTSEVEGLSHDGRHVRANRFLIRYRQGYTEVIDPDAEEIRTQFLDLGDVDTEATAQAIGRGLMANRAEPSYAHTLTLAPVTAQPYETFDNGDYITHPNETGAAESLRVRSITLSESDDNGALTWVLETNEVRQEIEERHENWLKRKAMGALAGGARVSSRSGEPLEPAVSIATRNVAEFSFQDPVDGAMTGKRPADSSGNLIEIYVEVTTEDDAAPSSATQVKVWQYVHGTLSASLVGTVDVAAGEFVGETDLSAAKAYRNIYKYRAEVVTVGGGVNGVDVQLRAI